MATTTQRGYGWEHQQIRRKLFYNHTDGTPCDWCGKPMYKQAHRNYDRAPLEADHIKDLKHHGPGHADRLLHRQCNRQRQDGQDHRKPVAPQPTRQPFTW